MAGSLGTGVPLTLKCSHCKRTRDEHGNAERGILLRTGRTRPYRGRGRYTQALARVTSTAHELWCFRCGRYMWSAHSDAARKAHV